jgi:protein ImuB
MHWIALQPQSDAALAGVPLVASPVDAATAAPLVNPLTALGWWALQYTPRVALLEGVVLLEVSASERLWGGRAALVHHVYTSNKPVAQVMYGQGATSLIAFGRLLATQATSTPADHLPLGALLAARPHLGTLARIGCTRWGQLRALPRGGVSRRFGAALLDALDQAYGTRPDVYPWLTLPEVFEAQLELLTQVDSAPAMLFGARRLMAQLQVWLQLRQKGVLAIELGWVMDARRNTDTSGALVLRTTEPAQDTAHLQRLLAEHLAHVSLPAPVQSLRLRSLETQTLAGRSTSLLPDEQLPGDSLAHLIERLSARLGPHKVLQMQACADHRPEQMQVWRSASNAMQSIAACAGKTGATSINSFKTLLHASQHHPDWASDLYPTWLLAEPLPLTVHQQQPYYQGPLTLLTGPQRLESGWWTQPTGADVLHSRSEAGSPVGELGEAALPAPRPRGPAALRDYFVARSDHSPLLWIYRERLGRADAAQPSADWYLQGVFG